MPVEIASGRPFVVLDGLVVKVAFDQRQTVSDLFGLFPTCPEVPWIP